MRKKALIAQNLEFFNKIESLRADSEVKDRRIKELERRIEELNNKSASSGQSVNLPIK